MSTQHEFIAKVPNLSSHWMFTGVDNAIVGKLIESPYFLRYVGLFAPPQELVQGVSMPSDSMRQYVAGVHAATDFVLNQLTWQHFREGQKFDHPLILFPREEYLGAELKLNTMLLIDLLNHRGMGYTIETLAQKFIRPDRWSLKHGIPENALDLYVRSFDGVIFRPENQQEAKMWWPRDWIKELRNFGNLSESELEVLQSDLEYCRQPYVNLNYGAESDTPLHVRPNWGVNLATLDPYEIKKLAKHGRLCDPSCHCYHGYVDEYKALNELIAPVDREVIGRKLLTQYSDWLSRRTDGNKDRFKVLIPAQADETTIAGLLDFMMDQGISYWDIKRDFYFVLADLCVTPLLRVYSEMKGRDLLSNSNIVSMDAFAWDKDGETFDFIAADHFIDLFPEDGIYSQQNLLRSLVGSLEEGGELVLTTRCGVGQDLTADDVMGQFYARVDQQLEVLSSQLDESSAGSTTLKTLIGKEGIARAIYALLIYRQLRHVYPFRTINTLNELLTQVEHEAGDIQIEVAQLPGKTDKACVTIKRNE